VDAIGSSWNSPGREAACPVHELIQKPFISSAESTDGIRFGNFGADETRGILLQMTFADTILEE